MENKYCLVKIILSFVIIRETFVSVYVLVDYPRHGNISVTTNYNNGKSIVRVISSLCLFNYLCLFS